MHCVVSANHPAGNKKWVWLALFAAVAFVVLLVVAYRMLVTPRQLSTYFARLQPGMSYTEITQFMPRAMISADKRACTSVVWLTVLVSSNVVPASEVSCSGDAFPLGGMEVGRIYFDQQDKLVGAYYNSSGGGGWTPRWGVRHQ
jgi:hypothetical protein